MEDYYKIAFKYANILTDLQEILQTLESEEEQQQEKEEKQEEICSHINREHLNMLSRSSQQESPDPQPKSQCKEESLHETEEQVWIPVLSKIVVRY